jgi:hypothetical protein
MSDFYTFCVHIPKTAVFALTIAFILRSACEVYDVVKRKYFG